MSIEHRQDERIPTALLASVWIAALQTSYDCLVTDLSAGGAGLEYIAGAPAAQLFGRLSVEGFGSFCGVTTRAEGRVLGLRFMMGETERQDLKGKLTAFVTGGLAVEQNNLCFCMPSGERHACEILDISLRGVSLKTAMTPAVGELLIVGRLYGRVTAHHPDGIALKFVNICAG